MKKIIIMFMALLSINNPLHAEQEDYNDSKNIYFAIFSGANFLQTYSDNGIKPTFDAGYAITTSLGYQWCNGLKFEAEYAYRKNNLQQLLYFGQNFDLSGTLQSSSYMANLIWELPLWNCLTIIPFIGGGIGYEDQRFQTTQDDFSLKEHKKGFAWQFLGGLRYPIFCNTEISAEYKFHKGPLSHIYSHTIGLGLTYKFGLGFLNFN